ncbi:peptide chain release factor 2 [Patescibacteria group bacterium]|nr:peptide chain release factor 2 [Patescibacteria group bacterium]MBU1663627.1 peptide chain release factor 2 [Patescibacteria group bacterium]MBU1933881.1 peptide chain release factor 2 [Patescibacteria group bacterium]MBU2007766.1 peptide chain release factor 2 [Patescibacteria group bacterium]MBU2233421.1 peptide chain release factor 2 [Patescibacteria group bacterium]
MPGGCFDLDRQKEKVNELKVEMSKPNFWQDQERAIILSKQTEEYDAEVIKWENLKKEITDLEQFVALGQNSAQAEKDDASLNDYVNKKYDQLKRQYEELEFFVLFAGKYDRSNAIISIHAGTGGVDAQDWSQILERMFLRFAEKRNWQAELVDRTVGNEAGIKSVSYRIVGSWAYGYLKSESGVHRLVRISPFDAEKMRHTSFALVEVIPELPETEDIILKDNDLRVDVFRSSGPGGQSVNKTDSAVRIVHVPTGLTVACQTQRSQHQNKETALKILKAKLFKLEQEKRGDEEKKMRGEAQKAEWGKQIRSYVMQPYQIVKDHRTEHETSDIQKVLDGGLDEFMEAYLSKQRVKK